MSTILDDLWNKGSVYETVPAIMVKEPASALDVADRLGLSLRALKLTQARLSKESGVSTQSLNNLLKRRSKTLALPNAIRICDATGFTLDWLYRAHRAGLPGEIKEALTKEELHPTEMPVEPKKQKPKKAKGRRA
jgi:transcriptional regulator with XRE-family HTH domain